MPYDTITKSFEVLNAIACGLYLEDDISHFWEILSVNFTVMTLHTKQFLHTIKGMAQLLEASITADGFGPRGQFEEEDDGVQKDSITLVLDKLTQILIEPPRVGSTHEQVLQCHMMLTAVVGPTTDDSTYVVHSSSKQYSWLKTTP